MALLYNLSRVSTATTGTGTITLGSAVSGYLTFALAGVADGDTVSYGIKDGANSEVGTGVYTSAGTTLTRSVTKSTNSDAAISLSGSAEVFITPRAEDLMAFPASSTDNAAARFDSTGGRTIQTSALIIADTTGALSRSGGGGIPVQGTNTTGYPAAGDVGEIKWCANKNSSSTVTISNASPAIITWTSHGLTAEQNNYSAINFTTTGALPTGLSTGTVYYITYVDANTFKVSTTVANAIAGTFVNTSSAGSGTHTAITSWPLTTATAVNIGGIPLTAGDWDVHSTAAFIWGSATNATQLVDSISQTTGTLDLSTPHCNQIFNMANLVLTGVGQGLGGTGPVRVSISATTTIYHVVRANFTVSTMTAYGSIYARRA